MTRRHFPFFFVLLMLLAACSDDETFSSSPSDRLSFSTDTVRLDTMFSGTPSPTYTFWVHNTTSKGLRMSNVRLERGNQSGFRVNVDGTFLDPIATGLEIRHGDSLRVFVEATTLLQNSATPQLVEDNLIFALESGIEQKVNLRTYSWDAEKIGTLRISRDTTIQSAIPLVVFDSIIVEQGATLTISDTQLFFHDKAGIRVSGTITAQRCLFRGDRLDHMFDYLPYDRISGQWGGIVISSPPGNINSFTDCDIRNATDAVVCDSAAVAFTRCTIHNSRGYGVKAANATMSFYNCIMSNSMNDCLAIDGGTILIDHCTLAQFYPFKADRGVALRFTNGCADMLLKCVNTLVTGYADDVIMGDAADTARVFDYYLADCILRTIPVEDTLRCERVVWETAQDSVQATKHFKTIDETNFIYDFTIDSISPAIKADAGARLEKQ